MKTRTLCLMVSLLVGCCPLAMGSEWMISGGVFDPQGGVVAGAVVVLTLVSSNSTQHTVSDKAGRYEFSVSEAGEYALRAEAPGFQAERALRVLADSATWDIQLTRLASAVASVTVTATINETSITRPDPGQRMVTRQETLDANPGRPGAPVSIPGLPIETASGGVKAPQYFVPGVAGDHGEPIAQYIALGSYQMPNNLSANAHGNGYADPNILIAEVISGVRIDGGAFNVLEGNHALNLATTYDLQSKLEPTIDLIADHRDLDLATTFSRSEVGGSTWIATEVGYGNGLLDRLEHHQQYKINVYRDEHFGPHELTLIGIGYYGFSYVPGLVPIDVAGLHDTIDPRQKDQTHTAELGASDSWKGPAGGQLVFSSFFRTYNLALYSNFGEGLIRQSEFRTVAAGNVIYVRRVKEYLSVLAGADYSRDAPRRLNLDRSLSSDPNVYGVFHSVTSNDVTVGDPAPFVGVNGAVFGHLRYYTGFRRDEIGFDNEDLKTPTHSFHRRVSVNNPKATVSLVPDSQGWLPTVSMSWGESFFTNDPRIGTGTTQGSAVERAHSYQLVTEKLIGSTDLRLTLGHTTTDATLAKIDPDTGLQQNAGPGRLRFLTAAVHHQFRFGVLQSTFSKADARDVLNGDPTPEAPRTIVDALGTIDRLPLQLHARGEFEYVGKKPLGNGFSARPVKELRAALLRSFAGGRLDTGLNLLVAGGYTGQTTEVLALPTDPSRFERVVGVRLASYVGASIAYHFRTAGRP